MTAAVMPPLQPPGFVSRYHVGEQRMQAIAGSPANVEAIGRSSLRVGYMTDQFRDFFTGLVQFFLATRDEAGRPWCSVVCGPPGFVSSPDRSSLVVESYPIRDADPVNLAVGQSVGGLGLMMQNRRRNRVNSTLTSRAGSRLSLRVEQAFGNCPKYIQVRNVSFDAGAAARMRDGPPPAVQRGKGALPTEMQSMVERSDTIFLATYYDSPDAPPGANGCDASHRGGPPGFVRVADDGATLLWPDYIGNWMFNTMGNVLMNSMMGVLFVDYERGATTLQLTGHAEVINDSLGIPGAQRVLRFSIDEYVHIDGGLPLRLDGSVMYSPYLPEADDAGKATGTHTATVEAIEDEAEGIKTFTLAVPTGLSHLPGQFASFDIQVHGKKVNRTWTVSSDPELIRRHVLIQITVKRAAYVSAWLHDHLQVDDTLQLRGFDGDFTAQPGERPVLLLAGGIGVTPMRAMLPTFQNTGVDVVLVYSVRTPAEAAFRAEFHEAAAAGGVRVVYTVTSATEAAALPAAGLTQGNVTWLPGRVSEAMVAATVPDVAERVVYMCGPQPYMDAAAAIVGALGVPTDRLYQESFSF